MAEINWREAMANASDEARALAAQYQARFQQPEKPQPQVDSIAEQFAAQLDNILQEPETCLEKASELGAASFWRPINLQPRRVLVLGVSSDGETASDYVKRVGEETVLREVPITASLKEKSRAMRQKFGRGLEYSTAQALSMALFKAAEQGASDFLASPYNQFKVIARA